MLGTVICIYNNLSIRDYQISAKKGQTLFPAPEIVFCWLRRNSRFQFAVICNKLHLYLIHMDGVHNYLGQWYRNFPCYLLSKESVWQFSNNIRRRLCPLQIGKMGILGSLQRVHATVFWSFCSLQKSLHPYYNSSSLFFLLCKFLIQWVRSDQLILSVEVNQMLIINPYTALYGLDPQLVNWYTFFQFNKATSMYIG